MGDSEELVTFKTGKIVSGRWKVLEKLGAGGCGAVYEVADITRKGGFITMTLCGPDLMFLKRVKGKNGNKRDPDRFSAQTVLRIGVQALYQIKVLHEAGFVHRDVKPGNMVIGLVGRDARTFFMIDYGMVREFVVKKEGGGGLAIRKARKKCLLRGTLRYCSLNEATGDEKLFEKCPAEFKDMAKHLRSLKYEDRPDYRLLYEQLMGGVRRLGTSFRRAYDWEDDDEVAAAVETALEHSPGRKKPLTGEPLEHKLYPTTDPKHFTENRLGI
ncbi:Protein kinase domain-containing protein [Aphelenchoides fujianensis]|nr:Protein kinase domain-containing protein [Aphelenchoides fujianensis]KAI6226531.1 Protein kinase domain-containing protein [Aphelenchoides fujianensis]